MLRRNLKKLGVCVLCAAFAILAGCTGSPGKEADAESASPAVLDPLLAEHLNIGDSLPEGLEQSIQMIEKEISGKDCDVFVRQTMGDAQTLYVLYDVTFAEGIDLTCQGNESIEPDLLQLTQKEGQLLPLNMWGTELVAEDGQTLTFLTYFCSWDTWQSESEINFVVGDFQKTDGLQQTTLTDEEATLSWLPTNQAESLEGEVVNETGEVMGNVSLSPFALAFSLNPAEEIDFMTLIDKTEIMCRDGQALHVQGRTGGTQEGEQVNGMVKLQEILDLETVTAVQIDGHTVNF